MKYVISMLLTAAVTVAVLLLLLSIFERKQEGKTSYVAVVQVDDLEPDPSVWGQNFPRQYEALIKTMKTAELAKYSTYGRYGGSESFSKLEEHPDYRRLFAGYGFGIDYNEDRGHARALEDMLASKRVGEKTPGTCMTCKSSHVPEIMKQIGAEKFYSIPLKELVARFAPKHSISCADCHDAENMALRTTRPALREAMSERGVNLAEATRQEMRSYVCAQCHAEYYFKGAGSYLTFPWSQGLTVEDIESYYDDIGFKDWEHRETGTQMVKIQHPEFELWSTGLHSSVGVGCADCHMPFTREGAVKLSDHWVRTPLANLTNACGACHSVPEEDLKHRVLDVQDRTFGLLKRAETAIVGAQDAILHAMEKGIPDPALNEARRLHRRATIRWDFISAENSMGFHSPQEAARILGDAIDYARQAELAAFKATAK
jgi:nitrite reductase (cytochrome c-552)